MNDFLDVSGYPTEEYLQFIRDYKPDVMPIEDFLKIIFSSWYHGAYGYSLGRAYKGVKKLELHTLGWSGNEDVIEVLLSNTYLTHFSLQYKKWETGGHYYFNVPIQTKIN